MPRKVVAYACIYRCGSKVSTSKRGIARHEKKCFSNPARQACRTCQFWKPPCSDEFSVCAIDKLPAEKFAVADCAFWQPKREPVIQAVFEARAAV